MKKYMQEGLSWFIGLVLLYAALTKLIGHETYEKEIHFTPFLTFASTFLSWLMPIVEITIGILLFIAKSRFIGLVLSSILFTIYLVAQLNLKFYIPNIRGGYLSYYTYQQYIVLNTILLSFSLLAILTIAIKRKKSIPG